MKLDLKDIKTRVNQHRKKIIKIINKAGKGHVGGAFSCLDLLGVLYYGGFLNISAENYKKLNRNRFILSKGHASIAQYVVLQDLGFFEEQELFNMNNGGILGEHPDNNIPGIEFISGSLGHGLAVSVGFALNAKLSGLPYISYVILGDGECHEGSVWEAASLASHLNLSNLVAIVDRNKLCIHGSTETINSLEPLGKRFEAFGWNVVEIDGHNYQEIFDALSQRHSVKPTMIIANTIKGKGVSFMENKSEWHHGAITDDILKLAIEELSQND
jgi:transketolase|tara:strand:+ start:9695 stop:10510 length:816 start_codon:yes stop_codon:yes gene_type:complete